MRNIAIRKINYRDSAECRNLRYQDMDGMTVEDAIFILQDWIDKYHEAESSGKIDDMMWLPRAQLIKAYEIAVECMMKFNAECKEKSKEE